MMNISLKILIIFFSAISTIATPVKLELITSFTDKYSYHDNRKTIMRDKIFSASKDCCSSKPSISLQAYPDKVISTEFRQIALWCDHCGVKTVSSEQIQLCQKELALLYKELTKKEIPEKLKEFVGLEKKRSQDLNSEYEVRFTTGSLKCDTKGGNRTRIDFYTSNNLNQ